MSLELVLLMSFVGLIFISGFGNSETGLSAQFRSSAPSLALRLEKKMATGKCFQVPKGGGGKPCNTILWNGAK